MFETPSFSTGRLVMRALQTLLHDAHVLDLFGSGRDGTIRLDGRPGHSVVFQETCRGLPGGRQGDNRRRHLPAAFSLEHTPTMTS